MKKFHSISIFAAFLLAVVAVSAQSNPATELKTVASVNLKQYSGKWYEIAKYPNKFQKECVGNTTATYTVKPDGKLEVLNQCIKKDGSNSVAKAEAKIDDKSTNAKLKVRFAPGAISFLPFVWANYWVIDLGPNYEYAVIAEPKREYFWILSRTPDMSDAAYQNILRRAETMGFNPGKVEKTPQGVESIKGGVIEKQ